MHGKVLEGIPDVEGERIEDAAASSAAEEAWNERHFSYILNFFSRRTED